MTKKFVIVNGVVTVSLLIVGNIVTIGIIFIASVTTPYQMCITNELVNKYSYFDPLLVPTSGVF